MAEQSSFDVVSGGVVYRSASGLQGYYPRVVRLSENEFVCSFVAGEALETPDSHPVITRSVDGGRTWSMQGPVDSGRAASSAPTYTETGFISRGPGSTVFCLSAHWPIDPDAPDAPIVHPETCGMRRNSMLLRRSDDGARTWTAAQKVEHGVDSPLEIPTGVVTLGNGDLLISFSTWKQWDGTSPYGHQIMVIRSSDNGRSWSAPVTIFHDPSDRIGYWECRIAEMASGRLIATCWVHDWQSDQDINNRYALSDDGGISWSAPAPLPVAGQTGWPMPLGGDRVLFAYNHRKTPVGVRALVCRVTDTACELVSDAAVFEPQVKTESTISSDSYAVTDFQFGAPSVVSLGANKYMVVYWCVVGGRSGINWTGIEMRG